MKLSDLFARLNDAGDLQSFQVYLAAPDKDGVDVDLASVARVELDYEKSVARLYPSETARDVDSEEPDALPGMDVLEELPSDATGENDLRLLIALPLVADGRVAGAASGSRADSDDHREATLVEMAGVHIGRTAAEVWFLAKPAGEFPAGVLPS
jgi:hypothetical protein